MTLCAVNAGVCGRGAVLQIAGLRTQFLVLSVWSRFIAWKDCRYRFLTSEDPPEVSIPVTVFSHSSLAKRRKPQKGGSQFDLYSFDCGRIRSREKGATVC